MQPRRNSTLASDLTQHAFYGGSLRRSPSFHHRSLPRSPSSEAAPQLRLLRQELLERHSSRTQSGSSVHGLDFPTTTKSQRRNVFAIARGLLRQRDSCTSKRTSDSKQVLLSGHRRKELVAQQLETLVAQASSAHPTPRITPSTPCARLWARRFGC